jgi:CBS domain-containing protein
LLSEHSIMTEKIARRGVRVLGEYSADFLDQVRVGVDNLRKVVCLGAHDSLERTRAWIDAAGPGTSHQGFPVLDASGQLVGVLTRRELLADVPGSTLLRELIARAPIVIDEDSSLRDAADVMAVERIGRLPVVSRSNRHRVIGIVTRSDLLHAHVQRLEEHRPRPLQRVGTLR